MTNYPLQQTCLGVIVGSTLLAAIFVFLRIYSRQKLKLRLGWDDWSVIASLIFSIGLIGPSWKHVKIWHVGMHIWDVPQRDLEPDFGDYYAVVLSFQLVNIPILPLVKVSMILLLLRVCSVITGLKRVLYGILVFTVGSSLIPWFLYIFICPPMTGNTWKPRTFGGLHCMGRYKMGEMLIWVTCANLVTDLLILPIPFFIVKRWLSASWRSKMVVCAVSLCGMVVTAIGAAKIYLSYRDRLYGQPKLDWTYDISFCISHIENNVAIIMANIPILRGLLTRWLKTILGIDSDRVSRTRSPKLVTWPGRSRNNFSKNFHKSNNGFVSRFMPHRMDSKDSSSQKIIPCAQEDFEFEFGLILPPDGDHFPRTPSPARTGVPYSHSRSDIPLV